MILTDEEVRTLALLILNSNNRWVWRRAGVAFPEDAEPDIRKIPTTLQDGKIKDNILISLRTKMKLLGEYREVFTEQNQGREAATLLIQCMLHVDSSSKWQDFIETLIPQKPAFIN